MTQNHKAHEGDVLTVSVFSYIDQAGDIPSDSRSPTTLIVSGGVDAKVGFVLLIKISYVCSATSMLLINGLILLPIVLILMIFSVLLFESYVDPSHRSIRLSLQNN